MRDVFIFTVALFNKSKLRPTAKNLFYLVSFNRVFRCKLINNVVEPNNTFNAHYLSFRLQLLLPLDEALLTQPHKLLPYRRKMSAAQSCKAEFPFDLGAFDKP